MRRPRSRSRRRWCAPDPVGDVGQARHPAGGTSGEASAIDGLTDRERTLCLTYLSNGFKGAAAWRAVSPGATAATCRSEASRCLAKPHVRRFLESQLQAHFSYLGMTGAEALGRVSQDARADIRELFDDRGQLLPPQLWPESIANSIESYELGVNGGVRIKLASKQHARRLILEMTGRFTNPLEGQESALARAISGQARVSTDV